MSKIKAVIYDVDGTMVNSEPLHIAAWDKALHEHGHTLAGLSQEFQSTMAGRKPIAIAEGMVGELRLPVGAQVLLSLKSRFFLEVAQTKLAGMPGAAESIHRLARSGYELAIGTSLDRDYVDMVLEKLNVAGSFQVIVTGDQIKNGKPHPETYLTVAQRLGRLPGECVVLEDATSGIQSARAAGASCIAVENPEAAAQDTSEADVVVRSLNDVTKELIDGLAKQNYEEYGYKYVGDLFKPHITLTRFENEDPIDEDALPDPSVFDGQFAKVSLCELGMSNTCTRKLSEFPLAG